MPDSIQHVPDSLSVCPEGRWAFLFAHPGHELRAHHLVERARPVVFVLTDGSGSTGKPRLDGSVDLLRRAGGRPGDVFGALTDREAYAALMDGNAQPFLDIRERLADRLVDAGVERVLTDAAEGYNPVHDVCHWMAQAVRRRAEGRGRAIELFEVDLVAHPDTPDASLRVELDDAAFERKVDAASRYDALRSEAEAAFAHYGRDAFRIESIRRVRAGAPPPASHVPYYEEVGDARVREGRYATVLRYGTHVRPTIESLLDPRPRHAHAAALGSSHQ